VDEPRITGCDNGRGDGKAGPAVASGMAGGVVTGAQVTRACHVSWCTADSAGSDPDGVAAAGNSRSPRGLFLLLNSLRPSPATVHERALRSA
jgi:hypothetical protein